MANSALSCLSCHIVRNLQILSKIAKYYQILSNIDKNCQKLSSSVQYCVSDYCLTCNIVSNTQILSTIVKQTGSVLGQAQLKLGLDFNLILN